MNPKEFFYCYNPQYYKTKSEVFKGAWEHFDYDFETFSESLKYAWKWYRGK